LNLTDTNFIVELSAIFSKIITSAMIVFAVWIFYMGWMVYHGKHTEKRLLSIEKKLDHLQGFIEGRKR
jgi:hypothetical protein